MNFGAPLESWSPAQDPLARELGLEGVWTRNSVPFDSITLELLMARLSTLPASLARYGELDSVAVRWLLSRDEAAGFAGSFEDFLREHSRDRLRARGQYSVSHKVTAEGTAWLAVLRCPASPHERWAVDIEEVFSPGRVAALAKRMSWPPETSALDATMDFATTEASLKALGSGWADSEGRLERVGSPGRKEICLGERRAFGRAWMLGPEAVLAVARAP